MVSEIARVLPVWPGRGDTAARQRARTGGVFGSLSARHAERAWEDARRAGYQAWMRAGRPSGESAWLASLDLVFIGALAAHVTDCERCGRVARADGSAAAGVVEDTPAEWLRWAVWKVPALRDVAEAVGLPRRNRVPWATVLRRSAVMEAGPAAGAAPRRPGEPPISANELTDEQRREAARLEWQRLISAPRRRQSGG